MAFSLRTSGILRGVGSDPPKPEEGRVTLPEKPSLDMDVNHVALKEYEES